MERILRLLSACVSATIVAASAHAFSASDVQPDGATLSGGTAPGAIESRKFTINPPGLGGISVGCVGVTDAGSSFTSDRDNTGSGQEAYVITATDGVGTLIHSFSNAVNVGVTAPLGSFSWNLAAPLANPITVRFVSNAGNGLPSQLVFQITGTCSTLPSPVSAAAPVPVMSPWGLAGLTLAFAGLAAGWLRTRRGRG